MYLAVTLFNVCIFVTCGKSYGKKKAPRTGGQIISNGKSDHTISLHSSAVTSAINEHGITRIHAERSRPGSEGQIGRCRRINRRFTCRTS